jgi:hypothetical protein
MMRALIVVASLLMVHQAAVAQWINSRDFKQDPLKLKVCMSRAKVSEVGEFEINMEYVELIRKSDPDATFLISSGSLTECAMNEGTGKYSPLSWTGENWGWHFIRPQQFKPGIGTPEGQAIAIKACGEAAKAKLDRPNFDHYSFFMPREILGATHWTAQQAANMAKGEFPSLDDRGLPVAPYDIEVDGSEFYKTAGIDLKAVSVLCLFSPMLEIKAVKTMDVKASSLKKR